MPPSTPEKPSDAVELLVLPEKTDVTTLYIVVSCIHIEEEEEMAMNNDKNVDGHFQLGIMVTTFEGIVNPFHILSHGGRRSLTSLAQCVTTNFCVRLCAKDGHECELKMFLRPIQGQVGWIGSAGKNGSAGSDGVSEVQVVEPKWVNDAPHERIGSMHTSSDYMVTHKLSDSTKTSSVKALTEMRVTSLKPVLHRWQKTIVWLHGNQKRNGHLQSTSSRFANERNLV
ncbi:hypothetical protein Tco_0593106 [Tanacetum coccineum]